MDLRTFRARRPIARSGRGGRADWFSIRNVTHRSAELYIYDEIGYWGTTAERFVIQLAKLDVDNIELHINSPGGDVYDGIAIYQGLRTHRAFVRVTVDSLAASAASFIAMAGDEIVMGEFAEMMIHDGWGLCVGNAADMREMAERLDSLSNKIAAIYAERAGGEIADWRAVMLEETWYSAEAAVAAGLADRITPKRQLADLDPEMVEAENSWDFSVFKNPPEHRLKKPSVDALDLPKPRRNPRLNSVGLGVEPAPTIVSNKATPVHHTATSNASWDEGPNVRHLPSPMPTSTANKVYGWYDGDQVEDGKIAKTHCKLPHHEVSADGTPGAAVLSACRNALARLPQSNIPESEHDAIKRHLNAHLDDGGREKDSLENHPQNVDTVSAQISRDLTESDPVIQSDITPEDADSKGAVKAEEVDDAAIDVDSFLGALRGAFDDD